MESLKEKLLKLPVYDDRGALMEAVARLLLDELGYEEEAVRVEGGCSCCPRYVYKVSEKSRGNENEA